MVVLYSIFNALINHQCFVPPLKGEMSLSSESKVKETLLNCYSFLHKFALSIGKNAQTKWCKVK